jgi:hypothetical protein
MKQIAECVLRFRANGALEVEGRLVRGGRLTIDYELDRLPNLTRFRHQHAVRKVDAFIKFIPGNDVAEHSLLEGIYSADFTPALIGHKQRLVTVDVPPTATGVELWFRTRDDFPEGKEAWDSQYGRNYFFEVGSD